MCQALDLVLNPIDDVFSLTLSVALQGEASYYGYVLYMRKLNKLPKVIKLELCVIQESLHNHYAILPRNE